MVISAFLHCSSLVGFVCYQHWTLALFVSHMVTLETYHVIGIPLVTSGLLTFNGAVISQTAKCCAQYAEPETPKRGYGQCLGYVQQAYRLG